jgi:peroxiredoxin
MTRSQWLGQRLLLVFVDPRCGFSRAILPELAAVPPEPADGRPQPILVCGGDPEENRRLAEEHGLRWPAVLQEGGELSLLYKVYGTPMAYLVDERGATVGRPAVGGAAVVALVGGGGPPPVASLADERPATDFTPGPADDPLSPPDGAADGSPAPDFRLPRLDGGELSLAEFRGQRLLLVFWAADCPACERLAPRLEVLHRLGSGPRVLAIARGDPAALRLQAERLGLSFPIALQDGWAVSRRYGPPGTPIAYVVDEQGRVAGPAAVGVSEIGARMRALLAAAAPAGAGLHRA